MVYAILSLPRISTRSTLSRGGDWKEIMETDADSGMIFDPGWYFRGRLEVEFRGVRDRVLAGVFVNQAGKSVSFDPLSEDPFEAWLAKYGFFCCQEDAQWFLDNRLLVSKGDKGAMRLQIQSSGLSFKRSPEFMEAQLAFNRPMIDIAPSVQGVTAVGVYLRGKALRRADRIIPFCLSHSDAGDMLETLRQEGQITEADEQRLRGDLKDPGFSELLESTPFGLAMTQYEMEEKLQRQQPEVHKMVAAGQITLLFY